MAWLGRRDVLRLLAGGRVPPATRQCRAAERIAGIEPARPAWKAGALPIELHPHVDQARSRVSNPARPCDLASRQPLFHPVRLPGCPSDVVLRHRGHRGDRTLDLSLFRGPLYRLSYMTAMPRESNPDLGR